MPPSFQTERTAIQAVRLQRQRTEMQLAQAEAQLRQREVEVANQVRLGAATVSATEAELAAIRGDRDRLRDQIGIFDNRIGDLIDAVVTARPPEQLFDGLDGQVPVALLPVRLETRFFTVNGRQQLHIRIFPDQVHLDSHQSDLLPQEIALGQWYWGIRWQANDAETATAWTELARQLSPTRAAWVVRQLTPLNLLDRSGEPAFPELAPRVSGSTQSARAVVLPDRWVAVGFEQVGTNLVPLFRKWGATVPDSLCVSPALARSTSPPAADDLPIDPAMRWATDYDEALRVGMAITIDAGDLPAGKSLAKGVARLVVTGVDWTLTPEQSATNLASLLHNHQYTDGFAFVPQGTPTNNTDSGRAGYTTDPKALAAQLNPAQPPVTDEHSASTRLITGLGLPSGSGDLSVAPYADLRASRTTALMIDALWQSTLGYYLDELLDPVVKDSHLDLARDHALKFLRPFGPFEAFRIGKQPYGLLPVVASRRFQPDRTGGIEAMLQRLLQVLGWYWREGLAQVSQVGSSGNPDDDLLKLLQLSPIAAAKRFRRVVDAETVANTKGFQTYAEIQSDLLRSLVLPQFASFAGPLFNSGKIIQMATAPNNRPLPGPWVQGEMADPKGPLEPNYLAEIARQTRSGSGGRSALHQSTRASILLEALVAHAALRELDQAATKRLDRHLLAVGAIQVLPEKSSLQVRSLIGIQSPVEVSARQVYLETPEQQAAVVLPALTGNQTFADYLSLQLRDVLLRDQPDLRNLTTFLDSLDELASQPVEEIDRAFRAVLDCYSYRLDAWYTSLAQRRLQQVRRSRPTGVYLGGYGWVENLRPDQMPDSLGYVHAPSLAQATTAALLRSGHLSHRGSASGAVAPGSDRAALNIDLSSERVRIALSLIEGVAQGQPLAALLGYRFERGLRDRNILLAQYILPIRKLAPYQSTSPTVTSTAAESIAARDVVDGVALLTQWRQNPNGLLAAIQPAPGAGDRAQLTAALTQLDDWLDAVSDLLVAETVYQTVQGNYERAGAALAALDRQGRPPEPQVIRTPRTGTMFQQRVVVVLQATAPPPAWAGLSDPRAEAEPRLNTWIAETLGDPAQFQLAAQVLQGDQPVATLTATLADAQLSPLSLVLASLTTNAQQPSELELRLAQVFARQVADPSPELAIELLDAPPEATPNAVGLGALRSLLQLIHTVITRQRPVDSRDLLPPEGEVLPGFDLAELQGRVEAATGQLETALTALAAALADPAAPTLRMALAQAAAVGAPDALPLDSADTEAALVELVAQVERVLAERSQVQQRLQAAIVAFQSPPPTDATFQARWADHLIARLRIIFGEAFPIVPLFTPANQLELQASQAEQLALVGEDPFVPLTWLQQMATVRPEVDALVSVLTGAELINPDHQTVYNVVQLPHSPGQSWVALTLPAPPAEPLLAIAALGQVDWAAPLAGLFCDGWSEMIPAATETTGLTFHYDAPAARPPQTLILAVPPSLSQTTWSFDALLDTVSETLDLAKLRGVGPREIPVLGGGMLPAVYLPEDPSRQRPSINLEAIASQYLAKLSTTLGKRSVSNND